MSSPLRWPAVIVASGALLSGLVLMGADSPVRLLATLWFLFLCSGMAFVPLLRVPALATELALGFALSLALDTLVATTLAVHGGLSATSGLFALQAIALTGCALQVGLWARARRSGR